MSFDVERVRAAYPALTDGYAYLDGAAGTQVPAAVIESMLAGAELLMTGCDEEEAW